MDPRTAPAPARTPAQLAALASAAVPQLDPVSVEGLPSLPEHEFDVAFVVDAQHRRWVVRAPRTALASARMERTVPLLLALARRLPFAVPAPKGFAGMRGGGRAMVYPHLNGHNLDLAELPAGRGLAGEIGRTLAAVHNADPRLFDEAGTPTYDAQACRVRHVADVDRAAASGRVPAALLSRWEAALDDVALWRFAPCPTHGDLSGEEILAVFDDPDDASTGRVRALLGWEDAHIGDPAQDLVGLVGQSDPLVVETVLEAYANTRTERPDRGLMPRARLLFELGEMRALLAALTSGDLARADVLTTQLRRLADELALDDEADPALRLTVPGAPTRTPRAPEPDRGEDPGVPRGPDGPDGPGAEHGDTDAAAADSDADADADAEPAAGDAGSVDRA